MSELEQQVQGKIVLPTNKRSIIFVLLCAAYFTVWYDKNQFTNTAPFWSAEYNLTVDEIAHINSAYLLGFFPMLFVAGVLCDKIGPKATLMISIAFCGILSVLMLYTHTVPSMYIRNLVFGLFFGFNTPSCFKLLSIWTNARERVFKVSLWNSFSSFSGIAGGPIAMFVSVRLHWSYCFIIIGVISAVLFILMTIFLKNKPEDYKGISQQEVDHLNEMTAEEAAAIRKEKPSFAEILEPLKHGKTWAMAIAVALVIGPTYVNSMWNSMYFVTGRNMDPEYVGVMLSAFGFWPFVPLALIPFMMKLVKGNVKMLARCALLVACTGYFLGALAPLPHLAACIMVGVLCYTVNPWGWGSFNAYWAATQKPHTLGMVNGLGTSLCTFVGWFLMQNSGKLIGDNFVAGAGTYTMLYLVSGIIMAAAFIPLAITHKVIVPYKKGQTQTFVDGEAIS
jgi:sugar phosphate permease